MQVVSMTEARNNFKSIFDSVYMDNDEVIVHRKGKENVVIIPFSEYSAMKETDYLLRSSTNREILMRSLQDARSGKVSQKELIEE
jgi:antitoxin YefM